MLSQAFIDDRRAAIKQRLDWYKHVEEVLAPTSVERQEYLAQKKRISIPGLNRALEKMDEGTYGECDRCDGEIPEGRLVLIPGAIYCLKCQEHHEWTEKQRSIIK